MKAIIFSRDRAMQLHCLLESLYDNCDIFDSILVIYTTTHYEAYGVVQLEFPEVEFLDECNFKLNLMMNISDLTCLLVDDDIIYSQVDKQEIMEAFADDCDIFSLRLGNNIRHRQHFNVRSSVDGNIFKRETLSGLRHENFENPNMLEVTLAKHCAGKTMCWFDQSKLVGIPNNKTSTTSRCYDMGGDVNKLQDMYLDGYRIDYRAMELEHDNVHKNEPLIMKLADAYRLENNS